MPALPIVEMVFERGGDIAKGVLTLRSRSSHCSRIDNLSAELDRSLYRSTARAHIHWCTESLLKLPPEAALKLGATSDNGHVDIRAGVKSPRLENGAEEENPFKTAAKRGDAQDSPPSGVELLLSEGFPLRLLSLPAGGMKAFRLDNG